MSTIAVTPETSAVSTPKGTSNSDFLPEGKEYRLKGELPEVEAKAEETEQDSSTAEASEASETQEKKGPAQTKTEKDSESRWAKLSRENRELREWKTQREQQELAPKPREVQQESQPAPAAKTEGRAEPKLGDIDPETKQPKYATLADYMADHAKWNREEAVREFREESAKTQKEREQQENEKVIQKTVTERIQAARKAYPDYDEVMTGAMAAKDDQGRDAVYFPKGSHLDAFFLDSERGNDVLYAIASDLDAHKAIFARDDKGNYLMNPVRQLRELAKIENSLDSKDKPAPAPKVTQAPRPPHQVSGKGSVGKDAVETAVEENDVEAYMKEQNARALARLKKGK